VAGGSTVSLRHGESPFANGLTANSQHVGKWLQAQAQFGAAADGCNQMCPDIELTLDNG